MRNVTELKPGGKWPKPVYPEGWLDLSVKIRYELTKEQAGQLRLMKE
jgi:hypothetical protein